MPLSLIFAAAIALDGVSGVRLEARSQFDANNVHVGDPMSLTVDFIGEADFTSLHPPALSREVDRSVWKIDDEGAKTSTYRDARRLVYRVRPMKEGVLEFPALSFSYVNGLSGETVEISTLPIPVHAKAGSQIALAGMDDLGSSGLPQPDGIIVDLDSSQWGSGARLTDDDRYLWRKACNRLSAEDFAKFDFPEARLNEAACEIVSGNWAKALKIYSSLEWRIGQIPAIERGIVAALALKYNDQGVELPVWRQTFRPVLRFGWKGRLAVLAGAAAVVFALLFALKKIIAIVAVLLIAFMPLAADAKRDDTGDAFEIMRQRHRQMQMEMQRELDNMTKAFGGGTFTSIGGPGGMSVSFNGTEAPRPEIKATAKVDKPGMSVGEPFNFIIELEMPKSCTVSGISCEPSRSVALVQTGKSENLADLKSVNPTNTIRRISIPCRYDAPFAEKVFFRITGMYTQKIVVDNGARGSFSQMFSSNFAVDSNPVWMEVEAPEGAGKVDGYSGSVGTSFSLSIVSAKTHVATNDIVKAVIALDYKGYVPQNALKYEMERRDDGASGRIVFARYFVADGSPKTAPFTFPWYDTASKTFRESRLDGIAISYVADDEETTDTVVVNGDEDSGGLVPLRFAPGESTRVIGHIDPKSPSLRKTEETKGYVRVDNGDRAGWVRKEDLN